MKRKLFYDDRLQDEFVENGFVIFKLAEPERLDQLKEDIALLQPDDGFNPALAKHPYADPEMHCTFFDTNISYKQKAHELITRCFRPELEKVLVDYSIIGGNIFQKKPRSQRMNLHQHWLFADFEHTCFSCWIPLHDVDESNGTLQVVKGSHKIIHYIPTPVQPDYFKSFEKELMENHLTTIKLKKGEAVIFCDSVLHCSHANQTDQPRTAIQVDLYPSECTPVVHLVNQQTNELDQYEINPSFFINNNIEAALAPPQGSKKIKSFPNPNRPIDYDEFLFRMKEGDYVRESLYAGEKFEFKPFTRETAVPPTAPPRKTVWKKLAGMFGN